MESKKITEFEQLEPHECTAFIKNMYKGAHLHVHYSAAVHAQRLVDYLTTHFESKLHFKDDPKKPALYFISKNCTLKPNVSGEQARQRILSRIMTVWGESKSMHETFDKIGNMFFMVIKNEEFYKHYLYILMQIMENQRVDHIELRLKLGSMYYYSKSRNKSKHFLTEQDELKLLHEVQQEFCKKGLSFVIIAQFSKHKSPKDAYNYFSNLLHLLHKKPQYQAVVKGFDLVGDESAGNALQQYESTVQLLQTEMKKYNLNIPFVFHAGETPMDKQRSLDNIEFALKYGCNRIGHGIYAYLDPIIMKKVKDNGTILEFCPCSMDFFGHLEKDTITQFRAAGLNYSINADDPNKILDKDIGENIHFLVTEWKFSLKEVAQSILVSINAALCDDTIRTRMREKWQQEFGYLFEQPPCPVE